MDFLAGEVIALDKPYGWTSFDLVNKFRFALQRHLGLKHVKVGHAGTLDPLATGVLILCTGRATRRIEEFQHQTKEYLATLCLGATTPSFDLEEPIDHTYPIEHITLAAVREVVPRFLGTISQVPPAFSACKIDGRRAYARARKGEDVQLPPKTLTIDELEIVDFTPPHLKIRVVCSKGTYIRALARDMGVALHSGAHLTALTRTRIGDIRLGDCLTVEQIPDFFAQNPQQA
jgi:tRNA pseudouridine55 synthase